MEEKAMKIIALDRLSQEGCTHDAVVHFPDSGYVGEVLAEAIRQGLLPNDIRDGERFLLVSTDELERRLEPAWVLTLGITPPRPQEITVDYAGNVTKV